MTNFERVTIDPAQMGGVPCVRHLRIPVATVLRLLAGGLSEREILADYPDLELADIRAVARGESTELESLSHDPGQFTSRSIYNLAVQGEKACEHVKVRPGAPALPRSAAGRTAA